MSGNKKTWIRVLMLVLAGLMALAAILLPFLGW